MFVRYDESVIEEIHRKLEYNSETGDLTWKFVEPRNGFDRRYNNTFAGKVAGTLKKGKNKFGYKEIHIKKKIISNHKLAWYFYYGEWPDKEIDHINHDRSDNRIENLRLVDRTAQNQSACRRKDNKSGHTGVYWNKRENKWLATIQCNKKTYRIGRFENLEDAVEARLKKAKELGFSETHGKNLSKYAWHE